MIQTSTARSKRPLQDCTPAGTRLDIGRWQMELREYEHHHLPAIVTRLTRNNLLYGDAEAYDSLLTPVSVVISAAEESELERDAEALWQMYAALNTLYRESRATPELAWF